jgi:hypothetical protein
MALYYHQKAQLNREPHEHLQVQRGSQSTHVHDPGPNTFEQIKCSCKSSRISLNDIPHSGPCPSPFSKLLHSLSWLEFVSSWMHEMAWSLANSKAFMQAGASVIRASCICPAFLAPARLQAPDTHCISNHKSRGSLSCLLHVLCRHDDRMKPTPTCL